MVLHSVHDINPARLNAIMPALQQMEDDPAFLERRRHRFDEDVPSPPPSSSGSTTQLPTPNPFPPVVDNDVNVGELLRKPLTNEEIYGLREEVRHYLPSHRYYHEKSQERSRIYEENSRQDENYNRLYRGPNLKGDRGGQRLDVMIRHSIKKRWERLGVWNPEWGIPGRVHTGPKNVIGKWKWDREQSYYDRNYMRQPLETQMATWPSREEESPSDRAVRLHLEKQGVWSKTHGPQQLESSDAIDLHVDDRELLVTSRPWFMWGLEVAEEEVRLRRVPEYMEIYHQARANVAARWKVKGCWKDSWGDLPGWKWRHESASPEPADPNDMDFTPSELDALEEIPPPIPPVKALAPVLGDRDGDHEGNKPGATSEPEEPPPDLRSYQPEELRDNDTHSYEQQHLPTTRRLTQATCRIARSTKHSGEPSPAVPKPRLGKDASPALTQPSKISKPNSASRRSVRIAEREQQSKEGSGARPKSVKATDKEDPKLAQASQPLKKPKQQKKKSPTKTPKKKGRPQRNVRQHRQSRKESQSGRAALLVRDD
ncbi:MAG: hypothetical protein Q9225_001547 [Loekoesia sp. 1 TL-2023]